MCFGFTDTVDWRNSLNPEDRLRSYEDLVAWSAKKGLVGTTEARKLRGLLGRSPSLQADLLSEARGLREAIYRIFSASAHGRRVALDDLADLNAILSKGLGQMIVSPTAEGFVWSWKGETTPEVLLFPVAQSAANLLTSEDLNRVKECANEEQGCGSLFLDSSKAQTRKWCSMESCGTKVKLRKYYARHKGETLDMRNSEKARS